MEFFEKAKSVRLRSHHDKYLLADDDLESVYQDRDGSSNSAKWTLEFVDSVINAIRLKSCYGKYLTPVDEPYLLGVTGQKVLQTSPTKLDSSVEWEPVRDGVLVRLKTRYGNYLRANGGIPPYRNSITHDIPHRHLDWVLWEVDVVEEMMPHSLESNFDFRSSSFHLLSPRLSNAQSSDSLNGSPVKSDGRTIYYNVVDDNGDFEGGIDGPSFNFKGNGVKELTNKLEEETGLQNIIVCSRSSLNGKLYPLQLALPPNNATMHVVVVPSSMKVARDLVLESPTST